MELNYPGEKLLHPSLYGVEEYLVVGLSLFVVVVMIKHLIYHTLYFWWYRQGQFYVPDKIWSFLSGKSLTKRLEKHVTSSTQGNAISIDKLMTVLDTYFKNKEFAPSLSTTKGKIVDDIIVEYQPKEVLIVGCHIGYVLLQILRSSPKDVRIFVVENNPDYVVFAKFLLKTLSQLDQNKAFLIENNLNKEVLDNMITDYGIRKFDFVFLNRSEHDLPSHVPLLKLLEGDENGGYFHSVTEGSETPRSVVLADKVILLGDSEFLKYVRSSEKYETQYYQMALEHSSNEIVDGMEKAVYIGN